jgi:hypothetical protein
MDGRPDDSPVLNSTLEGQPGRSSCLLRSVGAIVVALGLSCGMCWLLLPDLCGEEDVVRAVSPAGHAEARTFLWNCGATTRYVNVAMLKVDGWVWNHEQELYRSERGGMPQLRWAAADRLIVDCTQCAARPHDFVFHGVSVSYVTHDDP